MQTARARTDQVLCGAPLDNGDVDSRQCQLARQHQACWASPGNHHRVVRRWFNPHFATSVR